MKHWKTDLQKEKEKLKEKVYLTPKIDCDTGSLSEIKIQR